MADNSLNLEFFSNGDSDTYRRLMAQAAAAVADLLEVTSAPAKPRTISDVAAAADELPLSAAPIGPERAVAEIAELIAPELVYFHSPGYVAHLNCPVELTAVAAEVFIAGFNTSLDTYDQSRIGTCVERRLIDWVCGLVGFPEGSDGIFTSGGSQSNLEGLLLARQTALKGLDLDERVEAQARLVIFASADSHFSVHKSAMILGLRRDAVVPVPVDRHGRMDSSALQASITNALENDRIPLAVVATAGTTDRGSIDPLREIADIADRYGIWLHVDAAYGGGLLVSKKHRDELRGIERARSVVIDFHKMFFQPLASSVLLVRHGVDLSDIEWHADYLNPENGDEPNQVDKSLQTSRRFDALKLYATLRAVGIEALGETIDNLIAFTAEAHARIDQHPAFTLLSETQLTTALFRWQPEGISDDQADAAVAGIRTTLQREGSVFVARSTFNSRPCLKFTFLNPAMTIDQLDRILSTIATAGHSLSIPQTGR